MGSTIQPGPSQTEQQKAEGEQDCRPTQNNCTKSGVGPSCELDERAGASSKRSCLEEAKQNCEEKLKRCLQACEEEHERGFSDISSYAGIPGTKHITSNVMPEVGGQMAHQAPYSMNQNAAVDITKFGGRTFRQVMVDDATCRADCYRQAASDCKTVQCYCGSYKCEFDGDSNDSLDGGGGNDTQDGGGDDNDNNDDEYTRRYTRDKISEIAFNTVSRYGDPIELIYSRAFLPGNVTWISPLSTSQSQRIVVTVDAASHTITMRTAIDISNTVSMHVALCQGEVDFLKTLTVEGVKVFDADVPATFSDNIRLIEGRESQKVRAELAADKGFGRAPAYRGTAFLSLSSFSLSGLRGFPKFSAEVFRQASTSHVITQSTTFSGIDDSQIWHIDFPARRLMFETSGGATCLDLDSMEEVWTEPVSDAIEVLPMGKLLRYNGSTISVFEPGLSADAGSFAAGLAISDSYVFRLSDSVGNAGHYLVTENVTGTILVEQIDAITPNFPDDAVGYRSFTGVDTAPHPLGLVMTSTNTGALVPAHRSIYLSRVARDTFDTIKVVELRMFGDVDDILIEDEGAYTYTLPLTTFDNSLSLVLEGGFVDIADDTLVLFAYDNTHAWILKWSPQRGVVWRTSVSSLPLVGRYSACTPHITDYYYFIATGGTVYKLTLADGTVSALTSATGWPSLGGYQIFDAYQRSIIYRSSAGTIVRVFIDKPTTTEETIDDVILDIGRRSGIPSGLFDVSSVSLGVGGYRSAGTVFAADILRELSSAYLLTTSSDDKIVVTSLASPYIHAAEEGDMKEIPTRTREVADASDRTVTVNYFSENLNGEGGIQTFTLDLGGEERFTSTTKTQHSWTILESDAYMRGLAEVLAYTAEEENTQKKGALPPRYLAVTTRDLLDFGDKFRVRSLTIGSDLSLEFKSVMDSPDKYTSFAEMSSVTPLSRRATVATDPDQLGYPMGVSLRPVSPQRTVSSAVFVGVSDVMQEFSATTSVSKNSMELSPLPSGVTHSQKKPFTWGRLLTPPLLSGTMTLKTFPEQFLVVEFPEEEFATRILSTTSLYGQSPDYRTINADNYNTLLVGKEIIQYGVATSVPGYPRRVRFDNLLRGRHNTDNHLSHTTGELCVFYDGASSRMVELTPDASAYTHNLISFGKGEYQQQDLLVDAEALYPPLPGYVLRLDITTADSGVAESYVYPNNPHVLFSVRLRANKDIGFAEEMTDLTSTGAGYSCELYVLRADYDEALFESERNGTGLSYIMLRKSLTLDYAAMRDQPEINAVSPYNPLAKDERGYLWEGFRQSDSAWDAATEPTVVVLIVKNAYGESRSVSKWHAGGQFYEYPTRGLQGD